MKILLINSNQEVNPWPVIPLGLTYIARVLTDQNHQVTFLDLVFTKKCQRAIQNKLKKCQPDLIGVSIRNIDNVNMCNPFFYLEQIKRDIISACRSNSKAPIILGGSAVGISPKMIMDYLEVDYAVAGDGEQPIVTLINELERNSVPQIEIDGLYSRNEDGSIKAPRSLARGDFSCLRHPEPYHWIDYPLYQRRGGVANIQAKRGCVFNCIYCSYNIIEGKCYRLREPEDIADEIEKWIEIEHPRCIEFVDSTFNSPLEHAIAICQEINKRQFKQRLTTMGLNPGCLSSELMSQMRNAGFEQCMCSPDSASQRILENLKKNFHYDDLIHAVELFRENDFRTFWFFILGGPGETKQTVQETLNFCRDRISKKDVIHITIGFRVFDDTRLADIMRSDYMLTDDYTFLFPQFYCSPHIEPIEILKMVHETAISNKNIITYFDMEIYDALKSFFETIFPFNPPEHNWINIPHINDMLNRIGLWKNLHKRHLKRFQRLLKKNKHYSLEN